MAGFIFLVQGFLTWGITEPWFRKDSVKFLKQQKIILEKRN